MKTFSKSKLLAICIVVGAISCAYANGGGVKAQGNINQDAVVNTNAVLNTIAQINHINWVVNVIKSYNNVVVLEEEYDKISPGNLYLDRIPDKETLERIKGMLETLNSLRGDERQMKKWRMDFRESRARKIRTYKLKASKAEADYLKSEVQKCVSGWSWAKNPVGSIVNVVSAVGNILHFSVSLYNDYDNFVYELDKTARDKQFEFDTQKMDRLHEQNKKLLDDQWRFVHDNNLDDHLRVSDQDIKDLLKSLKSDDHDRIYTLIYPMRERFRLFPAYWYYLSCAAMETGHFKEGLEACDKFFEVDRGLFRHDPMVGIVAFNKAFMLPKNEENKPKIRRCLDIASEANTIHGDWELDYLVAIMYRGVFAEQDKAKNILEHAIALIEQENDCSSYGVEASVMLEDGLRNCRDALDEIKADNYRRAAEQGNARSQALLGKCYLEGKGVVEDKVESVKWFRKAAEQGNAYGQAYLGKCYLEGEGVAKDETEAVRLLRKAAEQGEALGQCYLGWCYLSGKGVAEDYVEAVEWFRKAAEQGDAYGQYWLGVCYLDGEGVAKDEAKAVELFRKAAEQGDALAQAEMGWRYEYGEGVEKEDYGEAAKWFQKAAEQGHKDAQYALGLFYYNGKGVEKNLTEASKWFQKAAKQGHEEAKKILQNLDSSKR